MEAAIPLRTSPRVIATATERSQIVSRIYSAQSEPYRQLQGYDPAGADEVAGFPSLVVGRNPFTGERGENQFLPQDGREFVPATPHSNKLLPGTLPQTQGPLVGAPTHVNPLGDQFAGSLQGDN